MLLLLLAGQPDHDHLNCGASLSPRLAPHSLQCPPLQLGASVFACQAAPWYTRSHHANFASSPLQPCNRAALVPTLVRSAVGPGWIRVGATLAVLFGAYYLGAAMDDMEGRKPLRMYQATILGRVLLAAVFTGLAACGQCGAGLLLLAAVNAAGAWRMAHALRSDGVRWSWSAAPGAGG